MSPVFTIAAGLVVALLTALTLTSWRRSQPNWTAVSIIVGIVAIVAAAGLFLVMIVLLLANSDGTT